MPGAAGASGAGRGPHGRWRARRRTKASISGVAKRAEWLERGIAVRRWSRARHRSVAPVHDYRRPRLDERAVLAAPQARGHRLRQRGQGPDPARSLQRPCPADDPGSPEALIWTLPRRGARRVPQPPRPSCRGRTAGRGARPGPPARRKPAPCGAGCCAAGLDRRRVFNRIRQPGQHPERWPGACRLSWRPAARRPVRWSGSAALRPRPRPWPRRHSPPRRWYR